MYAKLLQSCLILCDCMDCSPPGSSVHRILQARILEWVAMPYSRSRGSSQSRSQIQFDVIRVSLVSCIGRLILPLVPPGKSQVKYVYSISTGTINAVLRIDDTDNN